MWSFDDDLSYYNIEDTTFENTLLSFPDTNASDAAHYSTTFKLQGIEVD